MHFYLFNGVSPMNWCRGVDLNARRWLYSGAAEPIRKRDGHNIKRSIFTGSLK